METETMGRVTVTAKIENLDDLHPGRESGIICHPTRFEASRSTMPGRYRSDDAFDAEQI